MGIFFTGIDGMKKRKDITGLLRCLDHKKARVRFRAFMALATENDLGREAIEKLTGMLHDPDEGVRTVATLKFARLGAPLQFQNLNELMTGASKKDRIELLKIIAGRGPDIDGPILEVIVLALNDAKDIIKLQAVKTAGATRNTHLVFYVAACLNDRHPDMRMQAAEALREIGDEESVSHLIGLLVDGNPEVRGKARACLETIDSENARRALNDSRFVEMISGMGGREPDRRETAKKIAAAGAREALPLLYRACRDAYKEVRKEAARAIAVFMEPSSVPYIAHLLNDKFYDVRVEAVRALGHIMSEESMEALKTALADKNRRVREEAKMAAHRLGIIMRQRDDAAPGENTGPH
jgi:HEAT repeat protein